MRSNSKHTVKELENYILMFLDDGLSIKELSDTFGLMLHSSTFYQKVLRYQEHGIGGIQPSVNNNRYSSDLKKQVVLEHLEDGIPVKVLARKYSIPSHETVRNWIIKYTKGEEIKNYSPNPEVYTMKSRKTTQEEKIEIVKDCSANGLSYKDSAKKFHVPYTNVYSWVQRYKKHGPQGLVDGRGRGKSEAIQTDEEKLRTEIAALKARNEYLETENTALKKLEETERELMSPKRGMKQNFKQLKNSTKKDSK
ncbi:transposase [Alkalibacterium sp. 20]|nr:transposase [Alkalibacterium sp. 20]